MAMCQQWIGVLLVCGALGVSACSSARPPLESLSTAELAVRRADDRKTAQYAPLELRIAREKLDSAKQAMDAQDYDRARRLAEQALVDAQLAEVKASSESAHQAAQQIRRSIEALRREAERTSTSY
jgi:hypothetical protein